MKKYYVLDTNILLQSPNAIFGFEDNTVVITGTTLQKLDAKKNLEGEIGYNARQTARILEDIRKRGDLIKGVKLKETGGKFLFEPNEVSQENLPEGFDIKKADNRIISTCIGLAGKTKKAVILVTNDIMMRVAAAVCNVAVQEYKNDRIKETAYMGYRELPAVREIIDELYKKQTISPDLFEVETPFVPNEYITLTDGNSSALCVYRENSIRLLKETTAFGIRPQNRLQRFALDALLAPAEEIPLVILREQQKHFYPWRQHLTKHTGKSLPDKTVIRLMTKSILAVQMCPVMRLLDISRESLRIRPVRCLAAFIQILRIC